MKFYLVMWAISYGPVYSVPVIQPFDTLAQCTAMKDFITSGHGYFKDAQCLAMDKNGIVHN